MSFAFTNGPMTLTGHYSIENRSVSKDIGDWTEVQLR